MRCIAHRGFAGEYAENTVGAVASAADIADWVEVDVRRCGTGELVVVHDETVDRVTDSTGEVAELSQAELAQLNVLRKRWGIPTLAEVLEVPALGRDKRRPEGKRPRDGCRRRPQPTTAAS